ncbi:hypothetical protein QQ045_022489 [Rhodiola kirilowii]
MSDHHSKKRMKTLFSFYKKNDNNQGPTSETPVPCNDSPNSLPINEMEIPPKTETGNPPIIVDAPKESPHSPIQADPGLRQLICTFPVNEQDRIRREYLLMGPHQPKVIDKLPPEIVRQNTLRLKTTIAAVKYLGKEGLPFRGHDKSSNSSSRGHFIEIIKSYASMNDEIAKVVLENAPKHAMYIAPSIQKEILDIIATKI